MAHWYMENGERHISNTRTLKEIIVDHLSYGKVAKRDKLRFLVLAAAGEAGEMANDVKKEWRGDRKYRGKAGRAAFLAKLDSEVVDLANYVFMLAAERGMDLEAEMEKKLIEVEVRDDDWNKKAEEAWWLQRIHPKGAEEEWGAKMNPDYIAAMNQETYDNLTELGRIELLDEDTNPTYAYRDDDDEVYLVMVHGGTPAGCVTFVPTPFWEMYTYKVQCYEELLHRLAKIFDLRRL
jgi:NTP pyrophosphatase (non-canonical NTP hydrolase)